MLRFLSICLISMAFFCTAAPLTHAQFEILELWTKTMMGEEAQRLGITGEEYRRVCTQQNFVPSEREFDDYLNEDSIEKKQMIFRNVFSTNEVLDVLKKEFPKQHALLLKRQALFHKHAASLDSAARKFLSDFGYRYLDFVLESSKTDWVHMCMNYVETSKNIRAAHSALPQASKDALERTFCFRTVIRKVKSLEEKVYAQIEGLDEIFDLYMQ